MADDDLDIDPDQFDKLAEEMNEEWEQAKQHPLMKAIFEATSDPDFMSGP